MSNENKSFNEMEQKSLNFGKKISVLKIKSQKRR